MLKISNEQRAYRRTLKAEENVPVLAMSLQYSDKEIDLQVELVDPDFYRANPEDVSQAVGAFLTEMNSILMEAGMPGIALAEQKTAHNK